MGRNVLLACLVLSWPSPVLAQLPPAAVVQRTPQGDKIFQQALKSLVWVGATQAKGEGTEQRFRSGVLVDRDKRLVVTAYDIDMGADTRIDVVFPKFDGGRLVNDAQPYADDVNEKRAIQGKVVASKKECELAIVELESVPDFAVAVSITPAAAKPGQLAYGVYTSFKQNEMFNYRPEQVARSMSHKWTQENLDKSLEREPFERSARVLQTQVFIVTAQVGGPLINPRGQLIGILAQVPEEFRGGPVASGLAISAAEVSALLAPLTEGKVAEEEKPVRAPRTPPAARKPLVERRTWTDASGKFKVDAELIGVAADEVRLRKEDGKVVTVPRARLSAEDEQVLAELEEK